MGVDSGRVLSRISLWEEVGQRSGRTADYNEAITLAANVSDRTFPES